MGHKHTKAEILDGALAAAFDDGLSRLTFGRVAKRLGISDRIVVYYFPTKDDLIGEVLIAMGVQLLHLYKPPIRKIFSLFRTPVSYTVTGTFLLGLSFGAITIGRGAPMLIIVLTYIALYQTSMQGFLTMLIYGIGLSIPLIVISTIGGTFGQKIKSATRLSGEFFDRIIGIIIIIIGIYFLYLAFL